MTRLFRRSSYEQLRNLATTLALDCQQSLHLECPMEMLGGYTFNG